jgi:hypothetical protein
MMHEPNRTHRLCSQDVSHSHKRGEWAQQRAMFTLASLLQMMAVEFRTQVQRSTTTRRWRHRLLELA